MSDPHIQPEPANDQEDEGGVTRPAHVCLGTPPPLIGDEDPPETEEQLSG